MDPTQANPERHEPPFAPVGGSGAAPGGDPAAAGTAAGPPAAGGELAPPGPEPLSPQRGLLTWVGLILGGALLCVALGNPALSILFAGAGVFALAQATDAAVAFQGYRHWVRDQVPERSGAGMLLRVVLRSLVPIAGAALYLGTGVYSWQAGTGGRERFTALWSFASAAVCLLLGWRPLADRATRALLRVEVVTRTQRLTTRIVVIGLLLPLAMQVIMTDTMQSMQESSAVLASPESLVAQLFGEIAVALAGVGWLVRRRWPEVLERLGLGAVRPGHAGIILVGLAGAIALNSGMEMLQRTYLHGLWLRDQDATRLIAGQMPVWTALLLGISAGVGEEVTIRGALQPRLGIVLTSILFACGHVQYSWWGMLTIALLGMLLGGVRRLTNTTTAIVVHSLYDIFAVLTAGG
jgi:hypothetical protein